MGSLYCPTGVIRKLHARAITHKIAWSKPLFAFKFGASTPTGPFLGGFDKWVWITPVFFGLGNDFGGVLLELNLFSPK